MEGNNVFFRCIMLFYFRKGKNATKTRKKICDMEDAISDRMCQKCFATFHSGEMNIEDAPLAGVTTDVDQITALIDSDRQITVREIAARLNNFRTFKQALDYKKAWCLGAARFNWKKSYWSISISDLLYKRNEYNPFLKRIITGDEKWIIYNNVERKRSWSKRGQPPSTTSKTGLHPKKVMFCIWWNWKGIVYYELLPNNETIDSDKYYSVG